MVAWDLGISIVTVYVLLVVKDSKTCIQSPAAENMLMILVFFGMADVAEAECD